MNYYNPIGVVALPQGLGFNRQAFLNHVRESNMKCAVVLDDLPLCVSLGIPLPIYRSYTFEPHPGSNPKAAAQEAIRYITSHLNYDKVLWQINNEQDVTKARFDMYAYMIGEIAERNLDIRCVFGNFSSGSVKCGQGNDENEWQTKAVNFLMTLDKYPQHYIGVHEYTAYTPWYVSDGGKHMGNTTWKNRPTKIDWSLPQWHLGRNYQGIAKACKDIPQNFTMSIPKIIITEALIDRMNDVVKEKEFNGYKTYKDRWAVQFPEFSLGELYSEFLIWAWETIYAPVGVEAVTTFCYGNTGNWQNYNVADDLAYLRNMEEYRYAGEVEVPQPAPDTSNSEEMLISIPSDYVNLRSDPSILSQVILTVPKEARVTRFPKTEVNGWVAIRYDNIMGWVSLQNGAVTFTKYVEPPPPTSSDDALRLQVIQEAFWIYYASLESAQKNLEKLKELMRVTGDTPPT